MHPATVLLTVTASFAVPAIAYPPYAVLSTPITPPFPDGLERAMFGMGCFWGAERKFWQAHGVYTTAVGYAGGYTPNPTYEEVCSAAPATPRSCWSSSIPRRSSLRGAAQASGKPRSRRRACARATTSARSTGRRSTCTRDEQRQAAEASREATRRELKANGLRRDHDRNRRRAAVLLRRGLPPAVPREEPGGYCGLGGTGVACPVGLVASN